MILYFSATGNCEYVAKRIAEKSGDETVSVAERYKKRSFDFPGKIETLGIVSTTYAWGLPIIVREFLQQMSFEISRTIFISLRPTERLRVRPGNSPRIFSSLRAYRCQRASA